MQHRKQPFFEIDFKMPCAMFEIPNSTEEFQNWRLTAGNTHDYQDQEYNNISNRNMVLEKRRMTRMTTMIRCYPHRAHRSPDYTTFEKQMGPETEM
jgi:hypothetical protein